MKKKLFLSVLAGAMSLSVLAACGGDVDDPGMEDDPDMEMEDDMNDDMDGDT
ncbi:MULTISPECIES: hypothetical protein [Alteribacter]|uniref:hypothetical protein n=1 Tax=Alteribacter TaxID=2823237 RepID=UPI00160680AC|nr:MULTISPECIES: hypothetical protein [Alteribacter]MBM7095620.1 hypothetical protein [Alteribacter salitolerans]